MATSANDIRLVRIFGQARETDAERIKRFGWDPFCKCSYCGDTGMSAVTLAECFCAVGTALLEQSTRELHWLNLVPKRFLDFTLDNHPNKKLADDVGKWLDADPLTTGENLVIRGGVGRGKTGAAIAALRELHFRGKTVRYWFLPDLMDQLREDEGNRFDDMRKRPTMSYLTDCDCLLLDDMGTERHTDYVKDRLMVIFDTRHTHGRPTILTTNYPDDKWKEYLGDRIYSRLNQNIRYVGAIGPDLRIVK